MHLSLQNKINWIPFSSPKQEPMSNTAAWLMGYVLIFSICVLLGGCHFSPKPVDVGAVVQPNKVNPGPLPSVVAATQPKPAGYFQQRRLERETSMQKETMTPSTPTASTSPMPPAGPTQ